MKSSLFSNLYQRLLLEPLGLDTHNSIVFWLILFLGSTILVGLWAFSGDVILTLVAVAWVAIFFLSILRIDYSLFLLIGTVLFFDQLYILSADLFNNWMYDVGSLNEIPFLTHLSYGFINPLDLHLLFIFLSLFLWLTTKRDFNWQPIPVSIPYILLVLATLGAVLQGIMKGEDILLVFNEFSGLAYFLLFYLIGSQIIRTKKQVKLLVWMFILGISVHTIIAVYKLLTVDANAVGLNLALNSELSVYLLLLLILLLVFWTNNISSIQKVVLILLSPLLFLPFIFPSSQGIYVILVVSLIMLMVLLPPIPFWRLLALTIPCFLGMIIYTAVYWDFREIFSRPEGVSHEIEMPLQESYQTLESVIYHNDLNENAKRLSITALLLGTGFGNQKNIVAAGGTMTEIRLLDLIGKMGVIGFIVFCFFFSAFLASAVKVMKQLTDPYLKAVVMVIILTGTIFLTASLFDPHFSYVRSMILWSSMMALLCGISQTLKIEQRKDFVDIDNDEDQIRPILNPF